MSQFHSLLGRADARWSAEIIGVHLTRIAL